MNRRDRRMTMLKPGHYRRLRGERLVGRGAVATLGAAAVLGALVGAAPSLDRAAPAFADMIRQAARPAGGDAGTPPARSPAASGVYYFRCAEARAAGVAPIYAGQPGYRSALDRDGDGVACEPYRGGW